MMNPLRFSYCDHGTATGPLAMLFTQRPQLGVIRLNTEPITDFSWDVGFFHMHDANFLDACAKATESQILIRIANVSLPQLRYPSRAFAINCLKPLQGALTAADLECMCQEIAAAGAGSQMFAGVLPPRLVPLIQWTPSIHLQALHILLQRLGAARSPNGSPRLAGIRAMAESLDKSDAHVKAEADSMGLKFPDVMPLLKSIASGTGNELPPVSSSVVAESEKLAKVLCAKG